MTSTAPPQTHGILLLDKPVGASSFQALYPVKRAFRGSRIGHAGTLDPAASGLLVLGIGDGTRLLEFLEEMPKSYRFTLRLGVVTDTYDAEGEVLERHDASAVTREALEALLPRFRGAISQTPPAYSAIKIRGKRACDRVRAGESVALTPRNVRVHRLEVITFDAGTAVLEMDCSKGTYVRTVAHDLGGLLGCGGVAENIRRLAVGPFRAEDAASPDGVGPEHLMPLEHAVRHLPALHVKDTWTAALRNGNILPAGAYSAAGTAPSPGDAGPRSDAAHAVFAENGALLAIGEVNPLGQLRPRKVFAAAP